MQIYRYRFAGIILLVFLFSSAFSHSKAMAFWKTCLKVDNKFYHEVIDPDILEIGNSEFFAYAIVECEGVKRQHAFTKNRYGRTLISNRLVKIARNKIKICEGDHIFVGDAECAIESLKRHRW